MLHFIENTNIEDPGIHTAWRRGGGGGVSPQMSYYIKKKQTDSLIMNLHFLKTFSFHLLMKSLTY